MNKITVWDELLVANVKRSMERDPDSKISLSFRGCELAGEVGELCNQLKKMDRAHMGLTGSRPDYQKLKEELADSVICLGLIAMDLGIEVWPEVVRKFNADSEKLGLSVMLEDPSL